MPFIWIDSHQMISDLPAVCWTVPLSTACPWIPFPLWFRVRVDWKGHYTRLGRWKWKVLKVIIECGMRSASPLHIHLPFPTASPCAQWQHQAHHQMHCCGLTEVVTLKSQWPSQSQPQCRSWMCFPARFPANSDSDTKTRAFLPNFNPHFQILVSPISAHNHVRYNLYIKFFIP